MDDNWAGGVTPICGGALSLEALQMTNAVKDSFGNPEENHEHREHLLQSNGMNQLSEAEKEKALFAYKDGACSKEEKEIATAILPDVMEEQKMK